MGNNSFDTFICANSKNGFVSFQEDIMTADRIGVIKGGPGTGKSTFMKKIGEKFENDGLATERIHCSSDPDSLDGIYIRETDTVYFDGTSPHTQDLPLPGVGCRLVDLGKFWNTEGLKAHRESIEKITSQISDLYKRAYKILNMAGRCDSVCDFLAEPFFNMEKAEKYATNLSAKLFTHKKSGTGKRERRFFSAISHKGNVDYGETIGAMCEKVYEITDKNEYCAPFLLKILGENAIKRGYNTLEFYNPLTPEKCEFLYIEDLKLGIGKNVTDQPYLKINTLRFMDCVGLKEYRNRIRFYKKLRDELIGDAVGLLRKIKQKHDDLEKIYINQMDFDAVNRFTEKELNSL